MHFKRGMIPLNSMIFAAMALTMSTGCGLLGTKNAPQAESNVGSSGCLNNSKDLVGRYVAGQMTKTEWKSAFDCVNQSLDFFMDFVHGSTQDAYTQADMYTLVSHFLITNRPVHEQLMFSAFSLKAALFGGTTKTFTKEEIDLLKSSLGRLSKITEDLIPYLALRQKPNPSNSELLEMVSAFKTAGDQLADLASTLPTEMLSNEAVSSLITELSVSLELPASGDLSDSVFLAKWLLFNSRRDAIEVKDWPELFKTAMGVGGIMLAYNTSVGKDLTSPQHDVPARIKNDNQFRELLWELAEQTKPYLEDMLARHGGTVPFPLFDHLIDRLPASLFGQVSKVTAKDTLRPLFRKLFLSPSGMGFDQGVLDTVYSLLGETQADLAMLDQFYQQSGINPNDTRPTIFAQALSQYGGGLNLPADQTRFTSIQDKLLTYPPLFYQGTPSIRFEPGVGYSKFQGTVVLVLERLVRHLQKAYGSGKDAFLPDDLTKFFKDYTDLLFAVKIVDPTVSNFGPKRLQDMDLFTPGADGDGQGSISEVVNYAMMIMSSSELASRMRQEITAKCDRNLGQDTMGWTLIPADCFRKEFHQRLTYWIDQMPRLKKYWAMLSADDQQKAMVWLEHGARRNGYSQENFGHFDLSAMATILHYTETLFDRFDYNQNEVLSKTEILGHDPSHPDAKSPYEVFENLLSQKAKISTDKTYELQGIFTYIVKYREMPETSGFGNLAKLGWWLAVYTLPTTTYSADRVGVFNIVCQLASPENASDPASVNKATCQ